jgi:hypothetical protein
MTDAAPVELHDAGAAVAALPTDPYARAAKYARFAELSRLVETSDFSENLDLEQGLAVVRAMTALSDGPGSPLIIRNAYLHRMLQALINPSVYISIVPGLKAAVATALNELRAGAAVTQLVAAAISSAAVGQVPTVTLLDVECCRASRLVWSTLVPLAVADEAHTGAIARGGPRLPHDFHLEVRDYKFVVGWNGNEEDTAVFMDMAIVARRNREVSGTAPSLQDAPTAPPNAAARPAAPPNAAARPAAPPNAVARTPTPSAVGGTGHCHRGRRGSGSGTPTAAPAAAGTAKPTPVDPEQWKAMTAEQRAAFLTHSTHRSRHRNRGRGGRGGDKSAE